MSGGAAASDVRRDSGWALAAIEAVAAAATGHIGVIARHLETGQSLVWNPDRPVKTASTVKVAIHAALMRRVRHGLADLAAEVMLAASDQTGGSGILAVLRPGLRCTVADLCTLMIAVSDNTATNMVIDICGGVDGVNAEL
jgi:beta-lactamase class A